jgi:hypothetical protein
MRVEKGLIQMHYGGEGLQRGGDREGGNNGGIVACPSSFLYCRCLISFFFLCLNFQKN